MSQNSDIEVLYIIHESLFNRTTYRLIQHSSGKIRDVGVEYVVKYNMDLSKAQHITVKSIKGYSGKLKVGLNDFETYCRLNDLTKLLSEYNVTKNPKPANAIAKGCIDKVWWVCSDCGYEWQAFIKSRTGLGAGCPMCKHKVGKYHILVQGENDFCNKHTAEYEVFKQEILNIFSDKQMQVDTEELDIYLPELRLAIEFYDTQRSDKKYLQLKTLKYNSKGVRIINVFDYEWRNPDKRRKIIEYLSTFVVKSSVVYGRNLKVQIIDNKEAERFCEDYHLQGSTHGSISIGLRSENDLVAVMTLRTPRFEHNYQLEMLRYCTKAGVAVVGGAEKMFKFLIEGYSPKSVMTYVDLSKFTGDVYKRLGFKPIGTGITVPNYVWVDKDLNAIPRYKTQKQRLVKEGLGTNEQTEDEIMCNLGYRKVYDCGNLKLEWLAD